MISAAPGEGGKPAGPSNLQLRVASAIVLVVAVLALTWAGGVWYRLLGAAIAGAVLYEWMAMSLPAGERAHRILLSLLLAVVLVLLVIGGSAALLLALLGVGVVVAALHAAWLKTGFWPVAGLAYAGLCGISLAFIRGSDMAGLSATLFLFAVVWATDIFAYFVGRAVGGPKLAPSISPGKTWSGAIGGAIFAVLAGALVAHYAGFSWSLGAVVAVTLLLSVISQAGDLFESRLKRLFSVKDSSQLIPGHGGVMDRVDGLAAAALALFVVGAVMAGSDTPSRAFFLP